MCEWCECPACGTTEGTITISDTSYICGDDECGVHWNPQADDPEPYWPHRYAIGFCPRCRADGRGGQMEWSAQGFVCPVCDYEWYDSRIDGRTLASKMGFTDRLPSEVYAGHPRLTI